jgi:hypothetical protein
MEMSLFREVKLYLLYFFPSLFKQLDAETVLQKAQTARYILRRLAFAARLAADLEVAHTSKPLNLDH